MAYKKDSIVNDNIGCLVREMEQNYVEGQTTISKYVQSSMYEDINKIDAYINQKHTTGDKDSLDRDKPFYDIVTAARNIWYRATDIDRKNIRVKATKAKDTIDAFLATVHLQEWMRRDRFGIFLNEWGRVLATYGSAVVKFVEKGGELHCNVVPWQRLIVDQIDFDSNPRIEILELTEAQIRQRKGYDQDMVDKLCDARKSRELQDGHDVDQKDDYIKLYEIHGNLPLSYLTGKEKDDDTYVQQMHVISFVASKEKGEFDDFTLASGRERIDPYMITHLIKEEGQTLSKGAVQHLFDAQWMVNHSMKAIKDQLDLASKLIFQTSDGNFVGQNVLSAIETGDILVHSPNQPLTQVANNSHDITSTQNQMTLWKSVSNEIAGISESMLGNNAPAGTAWRQVEALLQQNQSLFNVMTQNKGLYIEDMLRTYVIPFIKKKMDTAKEVAATLEAHDISRIDSMYIKGQSTRETNRRIFQAVVDDLQPTPQDQAVTQQAVESELTDNLQALGSQRFFKPSEITNATWKKQFENIEWDLEADVVGEASYANEGLATLTTLFEIIADPNKRAVLQTPEGKLIFNKALNITGQVSPIEISSMGTQTRVPSTTVAPVTAT